jgi:hypothetical protein
MENSNMFDIDDLIEMLKEEEIYNEFDLTKQDIKKAIKLSMEEEAKSLVADCLRNTVIFVEMLEKIQNYINFILIFSKIQNIQLT